MRRNAIRVASLACVLALGVSGCGVPTDSTPRSIDRDDVPFDLLQPAPTNAASQANVETVLVYFFQGERLVATQRTVTSPIQIGSYLAALSQGPTNEELASGTSTTLRMTGSTISAQIVDGVARINVGGALDGLTRDQRVRAVAQVVFTSTELPDISGVVIEASGKAIPVPLADGSMVTRPIQRADYSAFAPA